MVVRVKLVGTGREGDAWRVPLPTYRLIIGFPGEGYALAEIPDEDHPKLNEHESATLMHTTDGPALIGASTQAHSEWYDHLDARYKEHKGEYRPVIA